MSRASHLTRTRRLQRNRRDARPRPPEAAATAASSSSPPHATDARAPHLPPVLDTLVTAAKVIRGVGAGLAKAGGNLLRQRAGKRAK
ncbi:MAG: hypothetical protein V4850_25430 [Myxococcota bacterium]